MSFTAARVYPDATYTMLLDPRVQLDQPRTVVLDARKAGPVEVTVPRPDAVSMFSVAQTVVKLDNGKAAKFALTPVDFRGVFVGQTDPHRRSDRVTSQFDSQWVKGPPDAPEPSPYAYHLSWQDKGRLPTGFTRRVTERDLATVTGEQATQGVPTGMFAALGRFPGDADTWSALIDVPLPSTRTEYYSTEGGVTWTLELFEGQFPDFVSYAPSYRRTYKAGARYRERRNVAVPGPGFLKGEQESDSSRRGNEITLHPRTHSPAGDWAGRAVDATVRTVVQRDGQVIFDQPTLDARLKELPAGEAAYRVSVDATRGAPSTLSTRVNVAWTFRSRHVPGNTPQALPLSAVRFAPPVNRDPAPRPPPPAPFDRVGRRVGHARVLSAEDRPPIGWWCCARVVAGSVGSDIHRSGG